MGLQQLSKLEQQEVSVNRAFVYLTSLLVPFSHCAIHGTYLIDYHMGDVRQLVTRTQTAEYNSGSTEENLSARTLLRLATDGVTHRAVLETFCRHARGNTNCGQSARLGHDDRRFRALICCDELIQYELWYWGRYQ